MGEAAPYKSSNDSSSLIVEFPTVEEGTDKEGTSGAAPEGDCDFDSSVEETEENECSTGCMRSGWASGSGVGS